VLHRMSCGFGWILQQLVSIHGRAKAGGQQAAGRNTAYAWPNTCCLS
jgi:hypothetical protein